MANNNQDDWQDVPLSQDSVDDWQDISETPTTAAETVSQKSVIPSEVKATGIGALVGSIPGLTAEAGGVIAEVAAKKMSPYTPEQLQLLSDEYAKLKTIEPKETMAKVGEQFSKQNRIINQLEKEAYANLSKPISKQEYEQSIIRSSMPFTREVDITTPEFLKLMALLEFNGLIIHCL